MSKFMMRVIVVAVPVVLLAVTALVWIGALISYDAWIWMADHGMHGHNLIFMAINVTMMMLYIFLLRDGVKLLRIVLDKLLAH